jgi:hypothetical protein
MEILLINCISHWLIYSENHMENQIPIVMSKWNIRFLVFAHFMYATVLLFLLNLNLLIYYWIILAFTLIRFIRLLWFHIIFKNRLLSFESNILRVCFYKSLELCIYWKVKMIKNIFCSFKAINWLIIFMFWKRIILYFAWWICRSCYLFFLYHFIKLRFNLTSITRVVNNVLQKLFQSFSLFLYYL